MTDKANGETEMSGMMSQAEAESLHDMLCEIERRLQSIGELHPNAFAPALFSLAVFTVEKIYNCSPNIDDAAMMLSSAQEQGLDNWVALVEAERDEGSEGKTSHTTLPN